MARGGARPGAGRPRGSKKNPEHRATPPDVERAARNAHLSPSRVHADGHA
jgi:hypothetical protein